MTSALPKKNLTSLVKLTRRKRRSGEILTGQGCVRERVYSIDRGVWERMGFLDHQTEALKLLLEVYANRMARKNTDTSKMTVTLAERARESLLARLVNILSQIISIEQDLIGNLSEEVKNFLRHKVRPLIFEVKLFICFPYCLFSVSCLRTVWTWRTSAWGWVSEKAAKSSTETWRSSGSVCSS